MQSIAQEALQRLQEGNEAYMNATKSMGDISPARRKETAEHGQHPYAVIVGCADSRAIPESIFSAGIGDLFVIRVAGNVVGENQLGSIEYAVEHLGCRLVVVLGHTGCGAVAAAHEECGGHIKSITEEIKRAVGTETDAVKASVLNVRRSVAKIREGLPAMHALTVGALYHTESGKVDFFPL